MISVGKLNIPMISGFYLEPEKKLKREDTGHFNPGLGSNKPVKEEEMNTEH